jgi:hypothetical protein
VQRTDDESLLDKPGNAHLDRDTDPHLNADTGATRAARRQEQQSGTIAGVEPSDRACTDPDRSDAARRDEESTRAHDEEASPGRPWDDPRCTVLIERDSNGVNRQRHRDPRVICDVQLHRPARDD